MRAVFTEVENGSQIYVTYGLTMAAGSPYIHRMWACTSKRRATDEVDRDAITDLSEGGNDESKTGSD